MWQFQIVILKKKRGGWLFSANQLTFTGVYVCEKLDSEGLGEPNFKQRVYLGIFTKFRNIYEPFPIKQTPRTIVIIITNISFLIQKNNIFFFIYVHTFLFNPSQKEYHKSIIINILTLKFSFIFSEITYSYING